MQLPHHKVLGTAFSRSRRLSWSHMGSKSQILHHSAKSNPGQPKSLLRYQPKVCQGRGGSTCLSQIWFSPLSWLVWSNDVVLTGLRKTVSWWVTKWMSVSLSKALYLMEWCQCVTQNRLYDKEIWNKIQPHHSVLLKVSLLNLAALCLVILSFQRSLSKRYQAYSFQLTV